MTASTKRTMVGWAAALIGLAAAPASAQQGTQRDLYKSNQSGTLVFQNPCTGDNMLCNVDYNSICHYEYQPDGSQAQKCHTVSHGDCGAVTATYPFQPIPGGTQYTHHDQYDTSAAFNPPCDSHYQQTIQEKFISRGKDPDFTLTTTYATDSHMVGNVCVFEVTQNTQNAQCK